MLLPTGIILLLCLALTGATVPRTCYSCEGINCQRTSRQNKTVACNDVLDICVTVYEGFKVSERGCLLGLSLAAQSKCEAKDKQCRKCSGELCNTQGRIDYQCIECNGSQDSKCNTAGASNLSPTQCAASTSNNAYCYVKDDGVNFKRGCALSLREQKTCLEDNSCSLCNVEDTMDSGACNSYDLLKSGAAQGQAVLGLIMGMLSLLAIKVSN